jgi:hypothetical protein
MSAPAFSYSDVFNANISVPTVVITDTTNYTSFNVDLMAAVVQCQGPAGIFYANSNFAAPDFNGSTGQLTATFDLPASNGVVQPGVYVFTITPQYNSINQTPIVLTVNYQFTLPQVELSATFDLFSGLGIFADNTILTDVTGAVFISATRAGVVTYPVNTLNPTYVTPNPIDFTTQALFIGSNTPYQLWSGTYQFGMTITATYQLPDGTLVVVNLVGQCKNATCNVNSTICAIRNCIDSLRCAWSESLCGTNANPVYANTLGTALMEIIALWMGYQNALQCHDVTGAAKCIAEIKCILGNNNFNRCSQTDSDLPIQILPLNPNSIGSTIIIAAGTYIAVSYDSGTKTYTISVNNTLQGIITTIQGDITTINSTLTSLQSQITAIVQSKYIKLYELDTNSVSIGAGQNTLASFVVPLNTLVTNGDELVITGYYTDMDTGASQIQIKAFYASTDIIATPYFPNGYKIIDFKYTIARVTQTTYRIKLEIKAGIIVININYDFIIAVGSGIDFVADTIIVGWYGTPSGSPYNLITLEKAKVELFKK